MEQPSHWGLFPLVGFALVSSAGIGALHWQYAGREALVSFRITQHYGPTFPPLSGQSPGHTPHDRLDLALPFPNAHRLVRIEALNLRNCFLTQECDSELRAGLGWRIRTI
jgi:hypothetical protein